MSARDAPSATYRVQLHEKWGFAAAHGIVTYIRKLGADCLYSSPILTARRGSMHGYDCVDPRRISDELGGDGEFGRLADELRSHGMGLLLDIVPNHMAIGWENDAWMDVLAHGRVSRHADWFDIAWPGGSGDKAIALPLLGGPLEDVVESGELVMEYANGGFVFRYYDSAFPIEPGSWGIVLRRAARLASGESAASLDRLAAMDVPDWRGNPAAVREPRYQRAEALRNELRELIEGEPNVRPIIDEAIRRTPVRDIVDRQPYRLCHWKEAMRRVAYRRFFDVTHLIGVRAEDAAVFKATHERILRLVEDGHVTGLRIDHIDGLAEPLRYLQQLRAACRAKRPFILVEKILASDETLDEAWPVEGTTGYDFMNALNGVFVDRSGAGILAEHQASMSGSRTDFTLLMHEQKRRVAADLFGGEVRALVELAREIAAALGCDPADEDDVRCAIVETSARLPVYRTYIAQDDVRRRRLPERDRRLLENALKAAAKDCEGRPAGFDLLRRILMLDVSADADARAIERVGAFIVKWQQFTGPLAAKGVEDTALYRDARLVSLNEVGADADHFERPAGIEGLHRHNTSIAAHRPLTMTCSSTHDTKRSEDVRARIHVVSEIAEEWIAAHCRWREMNAQHRASVNGKESPDTVAELFLYQNIVGAWPTEGCNEAEFAERMVKYAIKASREAKARTSWIEPNEKYEAAVERFVRGIIGSAQWRSEVERLLDRIAFPGAVNSLGAVLLKIASPGVPDFYQGTELWDFSLVDPDNRRAVEYERRRRVLDEVASLADEPSEEALCELMRSWRDGRVKMFVTHRGLRLRRSHREVFLRGDYVPLRAGADREDHVCAFARRHEGRWVVAMAAVRVARMVEADGATPSEASWAGAAIELPSGAPDRLRDAMTGCDVVADGGRLRVADALRRLPVALLHG